MGYLKGDVLYNKIGRFIDLNVKRKSTCIKDIKYLKII